MNNLKSQISKQLLDRAMNGDADVEFSREEAEMAGFFIEDAIDITDIDSEDGNGHCT